MPVLSDFFCSTSLRRTVFVLLCVVIALVAVKRKPAARQQNRKASVMDVQLSDLFSHLWDLDVNRCEPDVDYRINLQGYVTNLNLSAPDRARQKLFSMFNEQNVFSKPTYHAFKALLDNYESSTGVPETVLEHEERENWHFIDLVCSTAVMAEAHRFLASNGKAPGDLMEFKRLLYDIWFPGYKRTREDSSMNSSGFEHVFVGETRQHEVTGFHNWIQFYLQELAGHIDYRGYFRRGTTEEMEKSPRLVTLQFTWQKHSGKPIGSAFIGTSPEFEMALYTVVFLMRRERALVRIKHYDVELTCFRHGRGIGTAYPVSKSD